MQYSRSLPSAPSAAAIRRVKINPMAATITPHISAARTNLENQRLASSVFFSPHHFDDQSASASAKHKAKTPCSHYGLLPIDFYNEIIIVIISFLQFFGCVPGQLQKTARTANRRYAPEGPHSADLLLKYLERTSLLLHIPFPVFYKHENRQAKRHQLCHRSCQPDSVHAQHIRKNEHCNQHKHKGPGKRKDRRNHPVG